jgi:hypothetical protein
MGTAFLRRSRCTVLLATMGLVCEVFSQLSQSCLAQTTEPNTVCSDPFCEGSKVASNPAEIAFPNTAHDPFDLLPSETPERRVAVTDETVIFSQQIPQLSSSIEVNAGLQRIETGTSVPYSATQREVLSSAGTWGDFSRFLQVLPGAVWNSDVSNDVLIRGGNPSENLYVVDGIEVPNLNHLAVVGTTGGFTSMLDTGLVGSVELKPGPYEAQYSSRLSSLIEVRTYRPEGKRAGEIDAGISGVGGFQQFQLNKNTEVLVSAHRSILNLVTNDIGISGVPIYTSGFGRLDWTPENRDHVSILQISGADSIAIRPNACDDGNTLPFRTFYTGSRSTSGLTWQHYPRKNSVSTLKATFSQQGQDIGQDVLLSYFTHQSHCPGSDIQSAPIYKESTRDQTGTLDYGYQFGGLGWLISSGVYGSALVPDYAVAQPLGQLSPFNANPTWTDADSFARHFVYGEWGGYFDSAFSLGTKLTLNLGMRSENYSLTAAHLFEPRASAVYRLNGRQALNVGYVDSAQLTPIINIVSYPGNQKLAPIRASQISAGIDLWRGDRTVLSVEAYRKHYSEEPVSTEYPSLMLANMVDTLGQQFVWLPLKSTGFGYAQGVEMLFRAHTLSKIQMLASLTYSRVLYAAADGVLRPGNYDFPLLANVLFNAYLMHGIQISVRNTYATGRPYTPFDIALSEAQSRGIYDLTKVNALRGPFYIRLDIDLNRDFRIGRGYLNVHAGVENALNRQNFLGYVWESFCHPQPGSADCGLTPNAYPGVPMSEQTQMPAFPSGGVRYRF